MARRLWDWTPHEGQRELLTLRLADGSEPGVLVAACGRRWGKTEALATDAAVRLLTEPDLGQLAVAPTLDQAATLFDALTEKLDLLRDEPERMTAYPGLDRVLADLDVKRAPYPHVRRKSDRQTVFAARTAGRDGRGLRGKGTTRRLKRFRVIVDERAWVPDEAVERAVKPMLATVPGGGQLVQVSSPFGRRGKFYEDFLKGERGEGRYRAVRLPSAQNPLVDPAFLDEMRAEMTERAFRAEFLAEFVDGAGRVFPEDEIARAVCPDDYGPDPLWGVRYVAGVDWGKREDDTVVTVAAVEPDGLLRVVAVRRWRGAGFGAQIAGAADLLAHWNVRHCLADRTGMGDPLTDALREAAAARRLPCAVEGVVFTSGAKGGLVDALSLALARRRLVFPPHPDLLDELRGFEVLGRTRTGAERTGAASGGHDDAVCSLALCVRAADPLLPRASGAVIGASAPRKETPDSCFDGLRSRPSPAAAATADGPFPRMLTRLLRTAYRSGAARRAGAWLARKRPHSSPPR